MQAEFINVGTGAKPEYVPKPDANAPDANDWECYSENCNQVRAFASDVDVCAGRADIATPSGVSPPASPCLLHGGVHACARGFLLVAVFVCR